VLKTVCVLVGLLAPAAPAAAATVEPNRAAVGETIVVTGPPGDVELSPLDTAGPTRPLGAIGPGGTLTVAVPEVPHGSYRVVLAAGGESPVLEVIPLSQETSLLLVAFGLLLVLVLVVAGVVLHRRWRDAVG
jgi:hypothetical protein